VTSRRKGYSLLEILIYMSILVIILGVLGLLMVHIHHQDSWNDARLHALEGLLLIWEHIRCDLATVPPRPANLLISDETLNFLHQERPADPAPTRVEYTKGTSGQISRNGRRLRTCRIDEVHFGWEVEFAGPRQSSLFRYEFTTHSGSVRSPIRERRHRFSGLVHVQTHLNAARFESWCADEAR
jgi:type II secretory pathway component PulJ